MLNKTQSQNKFNRNSGKGKICIGKQKLFLHLIFYVCKKNNDFDEFTSNNVLKQMFSYNKVLLPDSLNYNVNEYT